MRKRKTLACNAMGESVHKWAMKVIHNNLWRVPSWIGFDDLMQDAFQAYALIRHRYPKAKYASHVDTLFRTTFLRHLTDLARQRTLEEAEVVDNDLVDASSELCEFDDLVKIVIESPDIVQTTLRALIVEGAPESRIGLDGARETLNQKLCRLIGDAAYKGEGFHDVAGAVREYLNNNLKSA